MLAQTSKAASRLLELARNDDEAWVQAMATALRDVPQGGHYVADISETNAAFAQCLDRLVAKGVCHTLAAFLELVFSCRSSPSHAQQPWSQHTHNCRLFVRRCCYHGFACRPLRMPHRSISVFGVHRNRSSCRSRNMTLEPACWPARASKAALRPTMAPSRCRASGPCHAR